MFIFIDKILKKQTIYTNFDVVIDKKNCTKQGGVSANNSDLYSNLIW